MEKKTFAELLTYIHYSAYNEIKWEIYASEEYETWFFSLDPDCNKNLKEIRAQTEKHILRVAYYFDVNRKAFLLTGGDKKGKNEDRFYKNLIAEAERIIEKHEEEIIK